MRKNVHDLSGQFISFQATMLDSLQVLCAELSELRQQQSHKHSHKRHHFKKHKKKHSQKKPKLVGLSESDPCRQSEDISIAEASAECPPQSSTVILDSPLSTLPSSICSSFLPIFVDSVIISVSPSISLIQDPTPVSDPVVCSSPIPTSPSPIQHSLLPAYFNLIKIEIAKRASQSLTTILLQ